MDLKNKVVLITGAGSGMGAETAKHFSALGAKIAACDINEKTAKETAKTCGGLGLKCDVYNESSAKEAIEKTIEKYSEIHIAIHCAGIAPAARIVGREGPCPLDLFEQVIQVNLIGTFNILRLTAAQMIQQSPVDEDKERGVIINTASVAAFEGQIGQAAYSASKGGVVAMTLPAAREFSKFGIRVMTIAPGIMQTPMMAKMPQEVQESLAASVTFPKRLGHASEYASLAQHIVENTYLNGEVIRLDGAIRMQAK